eukprot:8749177-Alexandrium_andersonii.AAC.1
MREAVFEISPDMYFRFTLPHSKWPYPALKLLDASFGGQAELLSNFMNASLGDLEPGFCGQLRRWLESMVDDGERLSTFVTIMRSWATYCRAATLSEEKWHAFNKASAGGQQSWAT